jgi:hypothetical protein
MKPAALAAQAAKRAASEAPPFKRSSYPRRVRWVPGNLPKRLRKAAGITGSRQSKRWHQQHRHDYEDAL